VSSNESVAAAFALWLCAAASASAPNAGNLPLIGWLRINTPDTAEPQATLFKNSLAALGLVDSRSIRLAEGHPERLCRNWPRRSSGRQASSSLSASSHSGGAARATSTIPIVADDDLRRRA
jgi:hypothetical protein